MPLPIMQTLVGLGSTSTSDDDADDDDGVERIRRERNNSRPNIAVVFFIFCYKFRRMITAMLLSPLRTLPSTGVDLGLCSCEF